MKTNTNIEEKKRKKKIADRNRYEKNKKKRKSSQKWMKLEKIREKTANSREKTKRELKIAA